MHDPKYPFDHEDDFDPFDPDGGAADAYFPNRPNRKDKDEDKRSYWSHPASNKDGAVGYGIGMLAVGLVGLAIRWVPRLWGSKPLSPEEERYHAIQRDLEELRKSSEERKKKTNQRR